MPSEPYNINEISAMAGVTPRTVHFYIQQGLLPHPITRGPGAKYERRHLMRLRLVRMLQEEQLPLAEIRERLAAMSDAQVEQTVSGTFGATATSGARPPVGSDRSQWERVVVARGVELHFRRPLTRRRNKQVEQLLEEARRIMKDGGPKITRD